MKTAAEGNILIRSVVMYCIKKIAKISNELRKWVHEDKKNRWSEFVAFYTK